MIVKTAAFLIVWLSLICQAADTATFTYKEFRHDALLSSADFSVVKVNDGYHISIRAIKSKEKISQDMICDSTYNTLQWQYVSDANTDLMFKRNSGKIELSGTLNGKAVHKSLTIDSDPWYQIVPLGLQTISRDSAGRSKFWAISLDEMAMLKPVCFCIAAISDAPLPIHPETPCSRLHIRINGVFTQIWNGDYFIRKNDHTFAYYQGFMYGSKKPSGTIESLAR